MKRQTSFLFAMLLLITSACSQEEALVSIEEPGKEVMAHFTLDVAPMIPKTPMNGVSTRSFTQAEVNESGIVDMWVVQFDKNGNFIKKVYNSNIKATAFDAPLVATPSSETSTLYFLANIGSKLDSPENEAAFKTQVKKISKESDLLINVSGTKYIPMYSKQTVTIPSTGFIDKLDVTLTRLLAKVKLTFKLDPAVTNFDVNRVKLCNVPTGITLCTVEAATTTPTSTTTVGNYMAQGISLSSGTYTGYFYLPENQQGKGTNSGTSELQKSGLPNATYIEVLGFTTGATGGDELGTRIYIGSDNYNDYNVVANGMYDITVTLKGLSPADQRVKQHERANCYLLNGDYDRAYISLKKANDSPELGIQIPDLTSSALSLQVYWNTTPGFVNISRPTGAPYFIVSSWGGPEGNGLVILKNADGKVVWSWHIWGTADNLNSADHQFNLNGLTFMDRNIGAEYPGIYGIDGCAPFDQSSGMLYQWGRKDPFLNDSGTSGSSGMLFNSNLSAIYAAANIGATPINSGGASDYYYVDAATIGYNNALKYSVNYPSLFIKNWLGSVATTSTGMDGSEAWGGEFGQPKSVYDPCPEGWRVPSYKRTSGTLSNFFPAALSTNMSTTSSDKNSASFASGIYNMMLPAGGWRNTGGKLEYSGTRAAFWGATMVSNSVNALSVNITNAPVYSAQSTASRSYAYSVRCAKIW